MGFLALYAGRLAVYLNYKKIDYLFNKNKEFITSWGAGSYGNPKIISYDQMSCLTVGNYTSIALNVTILMGANHQRGLVTTYLRSLINKNIPSRGLNERGDVVIGNDVLIGYGVTIIGPVTVGNGAILGAGAMIVRDVPAFSVVVGNPSRVVKYRFSEEQIAALEKIKWWEWSVEKIQKAEPFLFSKNIQAFIDKYKTL